MKYLMSFYSPTQCVIERHLPPLESHLSAWKSHDHNQGMSQLAILYIDIFHSMNVCVCVCVCVCLCVCVCVCVCVWCRETWPLRVQ